MTAKSPEEEVQEYLTWLERGRHFAATTMRLHRRICRLWLPWITDVRGRSLRSARPEDLLAWVQYRRDAGTIRDCGILKELCVLRTLYHYLEEFRGLRGNPAASLPELICRPYKSDTWLTAAECFQLLGSYDRSDPLGLRNYMMTALLWCTGLRRGELCALRWGDLDVQQGHLRVRKGKAGKQRQVFLNDRLLADLKDYRAQCTHTAPDKPVFPANNVNGSGVEPGAPISAQRLLDILTAQGRKAGLTKLVNPLALRHSFATDMFQAGVSIADLKEIMGHTDETETTVYVHVTLEAAKRLLNEHIANPLGFLPENQA
jgi:site-specific recombinase XerD